MSEYTYVSNIDNVPDIFDLPLLEGETEGGSPTEVDAETPLQGDDESVAPTGDGVEKSLQGSVWQVSPGKAGVSAGRLHPHLLILMAHLARYLACQFKS